MQNVRDRLTQFQKDIGTHNRPASLRYAGSLLGMSHTNFQALRDGDYLPKFENLKEGLVAVEALEDFPDEHVAAAKVCLQDLIRMLVGDLVVDAAESS
ncbi:MAG: hypothetical protein DWQ07_15490 [Chloroflexi bacterium]|nr:MAG: hypothetical protein DWQ07_15490 [Chloroflexota bacterium]MBL1197262.1 hypothetical protein [Chloroflexota bacterium]NOH14555.1 hypothetical protein [Chloroflexota bacterium]